MLRCCQAQSSPLFTNSLRSIDAGLLRGNDNINQSLRHNGPNQPEITGNVTMSYVSVDGAVRRICPAVEKRGPESQGDPAVITSSDIFFFLCSSQNGICPFTSFLLSGSCSVSKQLSCDHWQN